ncbi:acetolactate decarboxylase [Paenibacillus durus]|uniref:Alpha-acetolactate decarboxylase n=1 Tax=Paenibacillus durus ATCC 35681 TaxID=1333534 RepID=A0A0F7CH03_PAEDU|nr:acetolactate decarboxylase [Paenibacillus durus]AKG33370.1 alpha-acetolactate decarboxylase [Paenibacillus durus ATCC 35681]
MDSHVIYQASTMVALLSGLYDGTVTFGELKKHGDFGIGTFHQLDGEMIAFDGEFFHLYPDGTAQKVSLDESTPFSSVTFFEQQQTAPLNKAVTRQELEKILDDLVPSPNLFHAIRIDGHFQEVHTRTVPHQDKPYPPFVEVTKSQPSFDFADVDGVIAGFWTPAFAQGIAVAGYHLHFINDVRDGGGHVMDFVLEQGTISICTCTDFQLALPQDNAYLKQDLSVADLERDIMIAEGSY